MPDPVPPRHRRRERRRSRPGSPEAPPAGAVGGTSGEYAAPPAPPPVESPVAGRAGAPASTEQGPRPDPQHAERPGTDQPGTDRPRAGRRGDAERGLRGIVGAGPSQVGVAAAMRARDAARPTAEDLVAAEREVVIIRRHYVPPDAL